MSRTDGESSSAQSAAGFLGADRQSVASISSTQSARSAVSRGAPVRYVLSNIKPSLSYFETTGLVMLMLVTPPLTEPVPTCKMTHLLHHYTMHTLSMVVAWILATLLAAMLAELHHYYHDCGGLVSIGQKVCGVMFSRVILAVVVSVVLLNIACSLQSLSDMIERQTNYYFADHYKETFFDTIEADVPALLALLTTFLASILGVKAISRAASIVALLCYCSIALIGGYGIAHSLSTASISLVDRSWTNYTGDSYSHISSYSEVNLTETRDFSSKMRGIAKEEEEVISNSVYIDGSFSAYLGYMAELVNQILGVTLLISLTEDNKLKKPVINAVGGVTFGVCFAVILFTNEALAHVTSDEDVFMDQIGITIGVPSEMVLIISIIACLALALKVVLLLYSTCRVMVHVGITREESGVTGVPCKIIKLPIFVSGCQCLLVGAILFLDKTDTIILSLIFIFFYLGLGGVCHLMHRYKPPEGGSATETTPILGSMGALRPTNTIRVLLVLLVVASVLLTVAGIVQDYLDLDMLWIKVYAVLRLILVLAVIGSVSIIASFQQFESKIHKFYRRVVWTPLVPSLAVLCSCIVATTYWFWGLIATGWIILVFSIILSYDSLYAYCCCHTVTESGSS